jgi:calcineurin-like phosphoesterase family protein
MGLFGDIKRRLDERKSNKTETAIGDALDVACAKATPFPLLRAQPVIIFSDHHKGARDGADDFQRCERTYNAALSYYRALDYHLVELGDVEELWENSFKEVAASYPETLKLAAEFVKAGRYTRFFGNHDLVWKDVDKFKKRMSAVDPAYANVEPIEAMRVVVDEDGVRGELFIVHGHQGTADSDKNAKLSEFLVRVGWRRAQIILAHPWNTPSVDWALRGEHALHMSRWAAKGHRVLIAGHTHLPVFYGSPDTPDPTPAPATPTLSTGNGGARDAAALAAAHQAFAEAEVRRLKNQKPFDLRTPCYFNTGCCSFGDGDITGIELAGGEIRLVRWPCAPDTAPEIKRRMSLRDVFAQAQVAVPPGSPAPDRLVRAEA